MHPVLLLKLLALLSVANGAPVIAKKLLGGTLADPIDGGAIFFDGRPLLGRSKTVRGVVVSTILTGLAAPLLGLGLRTGVVVAAAAMLGDLFSSFVKRRLDLAPSSRALGLDQVPEALLPLLACARFYPLTAADIALGVAVFFVGALLLSRLFYRLGLRDRPY